MAKEDTKRYIWSRKRNANSVGEQVEVAHAMQDAGIGPLHEGIKKKEIESRLGLSLTYTIGTSLNHLEEIEIVESHVPSNQSGYAISERLDEIILGRVDEVAEDDIEALIRHIQEDDPAEGEGGAVATDGARVNLRSVVAEAFDITPESVEQFLRTGDQVTKLNNAIDAIQDEDELSVREDYGKIIFRNAAYRWQLTKKATELYET